MQAHAPAVESVRPSTILTGLLLAVVAPMAAATWALANWWPMSGAVWLAATAVVWLVLFGTAADE